MPGSVESAGDTSRDADTLDDPKLGQLVQFQMAESFPWANHSDICKRENDKCVLFNALLGFIFS